MVANLNQSNEAPACNCEAVGSKIALFFHRCALRNYCTAIFLFGHLDYYRSTLYPEADLNTTFFVV